MSAYDYFIIRDLIGAVVIIAFMGYLAYLAKKGCE